MSALPRVTDLTRERISREFDNLGPVACVAEIVEELKRHNPEVLNLASACAKDLGNAAEVMPGFAMFYRLLDAETRLAERNSVLHPLPRVTRETRGAIAQQVDAAGQEAFTLDAIDALERDNPDLLMMAHNFASRQGNYLGVMLGFALLYRSLAAQSAADRSRMH